MTTLVDRIEKPSITLTDEKSEIVAPTVEETDMDIDMDTFNEDVNDATVVEWRLSILWYLTDCTFPDDKWESRRLKTPSAHYVVMDEKLRWTATKVLLTCIHGEKTRLVIAETLEGEEATILAVELWLYG